MSETTHFGDTRSFRTKRYAYQSVPGLSLEGKRDSRFPFYMSIEQHIGFPAWLQGLELSTMLYEGHQGETVEDIEKKAEAWSRPTEILARQTLQDGDSDPRPMLLLRLG